MKRIIFALVLQFFLVACRGNASEMPLELLATKTLKSSPTVTLTLVPLLTATPETTPTITPEPSVCDFEEVLPEGKTEYGEHASDFLYSYGNWTDLNGNHLYFGTTWVLVPCEELTDQDYFEVLPPVYSVKDEVNLYLRMNDSCDHSIILEEGQELPNEWCGSTMFVLDVARLEEDLGVDLLTLGEVATDKGYFWGERYAPVIVRSLIPGDTFEQKLETLVCVWPDDVDLRISDYIVGGNWELVWRAFLFTEFMGSPTLSFSPDLAKFADCN